MGSFVLCEYNQPLWRRVALRTHDERLAVHGVGQKFPRGSFPFPVAALAF